MSQKNVKKLKANCRRKMRELRKNGNDCDIVLIPGISKYCDVTLVSGIDHKNIFAHRAMLGATSEYFKAMFFGSFKESTATEVVFKNISGDDLISVVTFCYTGSVKFNEQTIQSLMSVAHMLLQTDLLYECSLFLRNLLHPSNCIGIGLFAEHLNCKILLCAANNYIYDYFSEVIKNEEFCHLKYNKIGELLQSDNINIESEDDAFNAMIIWIKHNIKNRKGYIQYLSKFLRLEFLSETFITNEMKQICIDFNCEDLFVKATKYQLLPKNRLNSKSQPRSSYEKCLYVLGFFLRKNATVECYCYRTKKWTIIDNFEINHIHYGMSITSINEYLIFIGGRNETVYSEVVTFNLKTKCLSHLDSLNEARYDCGVVVMDEEIYVVGGYNAKRCLKSVERCVSINGKWERIADLNVARGEVSVVIHEKRIYAIGGYKNPDHKDEYLRTVECYDPLKNVWCMRCSLNDGRRRCGVISINEYLYAIGNNDGNYITVERYNSKFNVWTIICSMNSCNWNYFGCYLNCALIDEKIFIMCESNVETYDFENNSWKVNDSRLHHSYSAIYPFFLSKSQYIY